MAALVTTKGPNTGRRFLLEQPSMEIGRSSTAAICLESQAVSRHHARILSENGEFFVEDLGSSNGTYLNGKRIEARTPITEKDVLQVGPYVFSLRKSLTPTPSDSDMVIRTEVAADPSDQFLISNDPSHQLQVILEIAAHLGRTLDIDELLDKLVAHLLILFPQADRGMVLLCEEGDKLEVRAQRARRMADENTVLYSRTIVKRALDEGVGIHSEDLRADDRFQSSTTITTLNLRSMLCVPMIGQDGQRWGVIQLDRFRPGRAFTESDLQLLTAVGLQVGVVLENAALHAELLREERLRQEVALAREIQQSFLPDTFPDAGKHGFEMFARVIPAREVAGDLYDFITLPDGRLAFFIGDVSGKGMPAALFMMAVRILGRHLAHEGNLPASTLYRLNFALAADNPSGMFVTLLHGIYTPATGELIIASAGHPAPLLRRASGQIEPLPLPAGRLLGFEDMKLNLQDARFQLNIHDTLIAFTDGFVEARSPARDREFGIEQLKKVFASLDARVSPRISRHESEGSGRSFHPKHRITRRSDFVSSSSGSLSVDLRQIHVHQEFGVGPGLAQSGSQHFHRFDRMHVAQYAAQSTDSFDFVRMEQQFFFASSGTIDVDRRPYALVDQTTVQMQLHVAGAFEFLEDDLIHSASGVNESSREDGKAAAVFDVTGRTEKTLWFLHGIGVETAAEQFSTGRRFSVVCSGQARDRIQQDDDVSSSFNHAFGFLESDLADMDVFFRGFVKGAGDDFGSWSRNRAQHVGDFLRAFIDKEHDDVAFGVIATNAQGYFLQ
ncbi:MAG: hypothetical protein KatS3mg105_2714 [Gemmatales bacterium]|nr:MAG: hypothetical protein KatS3mg105_2714 [Gemmatales bacterium]